MRAYVIGTGDTKRAELLYVRDLIRTADVDTCYVDVGIKSDGAGADVTPKDVATHHPKGQAAVFVDDRGQAVGAMSEALEAFIRGRDDVGGVIGLGGTGGTTMITRAMRALPISTPKLMVSTVASGNTTPYVRPSDITMMYSVTDIAGLNRISRMVLGNAAHALAGMVARKPPEVTSDKPGIGLTMFGVTTPCVNRMVEALSKDYDCLVFHATGTGGQSMEKLVESKLLIGAIDSTTTEVADLLMCGVFPATEDRFGAFIRSRAPYVGSCGALDMVNFGPMVSVPAPYKNRNLYVHNATVTLMRTTPEENARIGRWIGEKLNRMQGKVRFFLPEGGVSLIDAPGKPFHDPEADAALFAALEASVKRTGERQLIRLPHNINDLAFADALVAAWHEIAR